MEVKELIKELREKGIDFRLKGSDLEVSYDGEEIESTYLDKIRNNKEEIVSFLKQIYFDQDFEIAKVPNQEGYDLSSSQRRLWFVSQFEDANVAYNISDFFEFKGILNIEAFELAFKTMIERHEILRTIFQESKSAEIKQFVLPFEDVNFQLLFDDLRNSENVHEAVSLIIYNEMRTQFNLASGLLFRAKLIQTKNESFIFSFIIHHIISDGWSIGIFIKELLILYKAFNDGKENPLSPLRIQYRDYSVWQKNQLEENTLESHKNYWINQFSGTLPQLDIKGFKQRPIIQSFNGSIIHNVLDEKTMTLFKNFCQERGGTLFMGLLSTLNILLFKYSNQTDIIIGSPIAGRDHVDLEDQIGFYVNTLALRTRFSDGESFNDIFERVKKVTLGAYEHQIFPFDNLIDAIELKRDVSRNPLFDIVAVLEMGGAKNEKHQTLENLEVNGYECNEGSISKFDLSFIFKEQNGPLLISIEYNTDIYNNYFAEKLLKHFVQLLNSILSSPTTPVNQLEYLNENEKKQLLQEFNSTRNSYPRNSTIVELFENQVELTPENIAVVSSYTNLSYRELNENVNQLANYLKGKAGVRPDDIIGIQLDRDETLIIAILAVLKSGAAYLVIEQENPIERIEYLKNDASCKFVIDKLELTKFNEEKTNFDKVNLKRVNKAKDLAYIIYTSGSLGKPKGVLVEHRSVIRLVRENGFIELNDKNACLSTGAISFDATIFEYFGMLLNGGKLIICSNDVLLDANKLLECIEAESVDIMWFTSAWFNYLVDNCLFLFKKLKTILVGGDKLSLEHIKKIRSAYNNLKIINGYGPTENTTFSACFEFSKKIDEITNTPIGKPINNSFIYVLDENKKLCPIGVIGDIYLSGDGLARGYLNRPELTAEFFLDNPFLTGELMYKSGDLGRWSPDGNIEFIGRKDSQVKIRGYRIELGEIEHTLRLSKKIKDVVVMVGTDKAESKSIIAYLIGHEKLNILELKSSLKVSLPDFMMPEYFVEMDVFPLTKNGKIDKKNLPPPLLSGIMSAEKYIAPNDKLENDLVDIWSKVLELERGKISISDNFFDLGGNSIKIMKMVGLINQLSHQKISVVKAFSFPNISSLAEYMRNIHAEYDEKEGLIEALDVLDNTLNIINDSQDGK